MGVTTAKFPKGRGEIGRERGERRRIREREIGDFEHMSVIV